jgi:EmrB/QacA subfamily drug resistance transporter
MSIQDREAARPVWTLVLASLGGFMAALDVVVVATAMPTVRVRLGTGLSQMEWTVNAYTLVFAVLMMTGAALGDRFGRRRMYVVGLVWFGAASALAALSTTAGELIAARAVQGAGAALLTPLTLVLVADAFPPARRGMALGVWGGVSAMGVAAGPVLGGVVVQELTWQWIFWVNVPVAAAAAVGARLRIRESRGPRPYLDVPGLVLVAAAMLALTWAPVKAPELGWGDPQVAGSLVLGALLVAGFVLRERAARHPMVPLGYFRRRGFTIANIMNFLLTFSQIGSLFFVTQFFQTGMGYSPLQAGVRLLVWMAVPMCVTPFAGRLADRFGTRPFLILGALCQTVGTAWIAAVTTPGVGYGAVVAPLVLLGVGVSLYYPALAGTVTLSVPREDAGVAAGTNTALRQLGSVFGVAIMSVVFAKYGGYGSRTVFLHGFRPAMAVASGAALCSVFAAFQAPAGIGARTPVAASAGAADSAASADSAGSVAASASSGTAAIGAVPESVG